MRASGPGIFTNESSHLLDLSDARAGLKIAADTAHDALEGSGFVGRAVLHRQRDGLRAMHRCQPRGRRPGAPGPRLRQHESRAGVRWPRRCPDVRGTRKGAAGLVSPGFPSPGVLSSRWEGGRGLAPSCPYARSTTPPSTLVVAAPFECGGCGACSIRRNRPVRARQSQVLLEFMFGFRQSDITRAAQVVVRFRRSPTLSRSAIVRL